MSVSHGLRAVAIFAIGAATGWVAANHFGDTSSESASAHNKNASSPSERLSSSQADSVKVLPLESPADLETPEHNAATAPLETEPVAEFNDPEQVVSSLRNGTDQEAIAALTRSLEQNVDVPIEALRETAQYGASSDLRLLAFRMYVDAVSDDSDAASAALNLGASSDDPNVRTEALARLAEFEQMQQALVQQTP